ncbi:MAG: GNAT family N-acetyltransferase [Candidatus Riflebacteria bacterium]|nr:GNAT family N-acetyltransferase [Candidatus Riflebacteria bacterium]
MEIKHVTTVEEIEEVRRLFQEYAKFLAVDLCFQGFEEELKTLPGKYAPPKGALLIAREGELVAGCVALRKLEENVCEMKRLFVRPQFKGKGIGRSLAVQIIREGVSLGYKSMRLDTLDRLNEAMSLYEKLGFKRIAPYYQNPLPDVVFWETPLVTPGMTPSNTSTSEIEHTILGTPVSEEKVNPWLEIPAHDYEAHMASPDVGQLLVLSDLFGAILAEFRPTSLAVLGCCTGNGFKHISASVTKRVVGVDINSAYLQILKERFSHQIPHLDLIEKDFTAPSFSIAPVSIVFAPLVFEYVNVEHALDSIRKSILPGGTFIAALQMSSKEAPPVTPTKYSSLERLTSIMKLVDIDLFSKKCSENGLEKIRMQTIPLKHGKALFVGYYTSTAPF